jgi:hypothetical protein
MLPLPVLSGSTRTCQERLRRRLRRSLTLDRTCPKGPEVAAIENMDTDGQDRKTLSESASKLPWNASPEDLQAWAQPPRQPG